VLLQAVEGRVWDWVIPAAALPQVRQQYLVSSAIRRSDGIHVRLVAANPPAAEAKPALPTLEDAYLGAIHAGQMQNTGRDTSQSLISNRQSLVQETVS
jgi:hypothetical protein